MIRPDHSTGGEKLYDPELKIMAGLKEILEPFLLHRNDHELPISFKVLDEF